MSVESNAFERQGRIYSNPPNAGPIIIPHVKEEDRNAMYFPLLSGLAVSATIAKLKTPTIPPESPWHARAMTRRAGDCPKKKQNVDIAIEI